MSHSIMPPAVSGYSSWRPKVQPGNEVCQGGAVPKHFEVGDHVRWNSEAGRVSGTIVKKHTRDTEYKGHKRHCTEDDPQYEIRSDKTDHVAMHKGDALEKID
jgi:hypothetical protein